MFAISEVIRPVSELTYRRLLKKQYIDVVIVPHPITGEDMYGVIMPFPVYDDFERNYWKENETFEQAILRFTRYMDEAYGGKK